MAGFEADGYVIDGRQAMAYAYGSAELEMLSDSTRAELCSGHPQARECPAGSKQ